MTYIASWQDHVKHGPAGALDFDTEEDALTYAGEHLARTGVPVTVWEWTPVEDRRETA